MSLPPSALNSLVDEIAERVAARVLAEIAGQPPAAASTEELWRLLTVEQVAARLGRSGRWVRERVKRGDLPFVKLDGGALAFELADVQAFAQVRRVSAERVQATADPASDGRLRHLEAVGNRRVGEA